MDPIAGVLIDEAQRANVTFDAFFANTMFHEVAHGLGIKNTITDKGTVREALQHYRNGLLAEASGSTVSSHFGSGGMGSGGGAGMGRGMGGGMGQGRGGGQGGGRGGGRGRR